MLSEEKLEALRKRARGSAETKVQIARDFGISRKRFISICDPKGIRADG
jgi:hypothetical protein